MARKRRSFKRGFDLPWERWLVRSLLFVLLFPIFVIAALRWVQPPVSSFMIGTKLELIADDARDTRIRYRWVDYERIAPAMRLAVIAAEDQRFSEHSGFDWDAIGKAMQHNQRSQRTRGASTITQQVAKNLFLWEERSWLRKGIETYLTFWIELLWSKQRILEVYLNIAQFGPNVFGVGAAAPSYFGRAPAQLSHAEAALLAAVLPAPRRLLVYAPSAYLRERQAWIQRQMGGLGYYALREIEGKPVARSAATERRPAARSERRVARPAAKLPAAPKPEPEPARVPEQPTAPPTMPPPASEPPKSLPEQPPPAVEEALTGQTAPATAPESELPADDDSADDIQPDEISDEDELEAPDSADTPEPADPDSPAEPVYQEPI